MEVFFIIFFIIGAYLIGGIPFGLLIGRLAGKDDVRKHGSGNIGATNVLRVTGPLPAVMVLLLDGGKGALVVVMALQSGLPRWAMLLSAAMVIVGHCFPVYLSFKGGKGVATTLGVLLAIPGFWLPVLILLAIFILTVAVTRYVSSGSLINALLLPVMFAIFRYDITFIAFGAFTGLLITYRHRENITRLLQGKESKIGRK